MFGIPLLTEGDEYTIPRTEKFIDFEASGSDLSWVPEDFKEFCSQYLIPSKILKNIGNTNFDPFDYQCDIVDGIESHRFFYVYKSRQLGISETLCAYIIWKTLLKAKNGDGKFTALIYSITLDDAAGLVTRIKIMMDPIVKAGLIGKFDANSKQTIEFKEGGMIKAMPPNRGRSYTLDFVLIDESDFITDTDVLQENVLPALNSNQDGKMVCITTPNPAGGIAFDALGEMVSANDTTITAIVDSIRFKDSPQHYRILEDEDSAMMVLHWRIAPHFDDEWAAKAKKGMSLRSWNQEYELQILGKASLAYSLEYGRNSYHPSGIRRVDWSILTIDPSAKNDYFAASLCGVVSDDGISQNFVMLDHYYEKGSDYSWLEHVHNIIEMYKRAESRGAYTIVQIETNMDPAIGQQIKMMVEAGVFGYYEEDVHDKYVTCHWNAKSKAMAYGCLEKLCEDGDFGIKWHDSKQVLPEYEGLIQNNELVREGKNLMRTYRNGKLDINARPPNHDDLSDCVAKAAAIYVEERTYDWFDYIDAFADALPGANARALIANSIYA